MPSTIYSGSELFTDPIPRMRTFESELGCPDDCVICTPDTFPFSASSIRDGLVRFRSSPPTFEMAAVTTLFFCTP